MTPWAHCVFLQPPKPAFRAQCQTLGGVRPTPGAKPHSGLRFTSILPSLQPPGLAFPLNNTLGELRLAPPSSCVPAFSVARLTVGGVRPAPGGIRVSERHQQHQGCRYDHQEGFNPLRAAAVSVVRFNRRHIRASIALAAVLFIAGLLPRAVVEVPTNSQPITEGR